MNLWLLKVVFVNLKQCVITQPLSVYTGSPAHRMKWAILSLISISIYFMFFFVVTWFFWRAPLAHYLRLQLSKFSVRVASAITSELRSYPGSTGLAWSLGFSFSEIYYLSSLAPSIWSLFTHCQKCVLHCYLRAG